MKKCLATKNGHSEIIDKKREICEAKCDTAKECYQLVEQQPSQEPEDDGEKLGPCGDAVCQDAIVESTACDHCELNPSTEEYEEENGSDDAGD